MEPEDLLPYYERELGLLRASMQGFAGQFPKIAARLSIAGEHSDDPHIQRMLESAALMNAGIASRLEDDVPEFARALIESMHGAFLRPLPACAIAQFQPRMQTKTLAIARGALFTTPGDQFRFYSTADVTLAPLAITAVRYGPSTLAPTDARLPGDTTGLLSITLAPSSPKASLSDTPGKVRLFLAGQREIAAALADSVLLCGTQAFVEPDSTGRWKKLPQMPLAGVGFTEADRVTPGPDGDAATIAPVHLLMEYCAFPEQFDFLDLDMAQLRRSAGPCTRITLHLAIAGVHADSAMGQRLASVTEEHLQLFCTPVVNLFPHDAVPVETVPGVASYPVVPFEAAPGTQVWSVEAVQQQTPDDHSAMPPFHSLQHGSIVSGRESTWMVRRGGELPLSGRAGDLPELVLVQHDRQPADAGKRKLTIDLLCTNGDLPAGRSYGAPGGDLALKNGDAKCPIVLLRRPTRSHWPIFSHGELWTLLSLFVPHPTRLGPEGIEEIRQACRQFAARSGASERPFDAFVSLAVKRITRWIPLKPLPGFVHGLEVTLILDETLFIERGVATLIEVMDRFFAAYASANSFVQLVVVSASTGALIRRCPPRTGLTPLI
ncbi:MULTISPECIES: type VI secretion system baseplate subunit TssF [Paraburkholderia]|uniref:type VI secretion system baseplate subunit TssF n=1 Tax=Paraburkholderia TaxID=1822464 RepID=UPI00225A2F03|nr:MULTISPECIES: type VI secretion system baseplate subunit TssF [Paraburkholderia]MCX4160651.1 type VI secretion system baseplate subunit TssF [Paraburkholderia megapolitana]MDN7156149.1 type VI secretion system baseplate subunit TssF [Paraburkholderia sp. CHISQ3]MDQ6493193.1 type VI secretion system baseplate subunit TssF [Paraburkholderia megapolitana]